MPELKPAPTLPDFQDYVAQLEVERHFADQPVLEKCLLLGEEMGELFKAVRKTQGIALDPQSKVGEVSDELADIFIYLCSIANRYEIDLEQAFLAKEKKNKLRNWQQY
ncbi:MazG nucleotide pyrophosphohydrolase domain-containing protein [Vibrio rhodolitus]|uniref:MazG nucleotide pyrophosphohydrolase domain-containing protein n=1 Tax=Vibrio rhodolitus TaxID=2231649 RepID=UPI000E0A2A5E|nr:MazG nucleotide pyrophosphohydrolase domain-containing protein [Vibrio rhodolitus]